MMDKNKASISILLDHSDGVIRAQGWLKGHVEVEPKERLPSGQVVVELVGKETVMSLSHNAQSEQVVFDQSNIHNILDKDYLEPGVVHQFPFSIYLPGSVPPSILYKDKVHLEGCSVKYHLTVKFASSVYSQEIVIVGAPLSPKIYPAHVGPTVLPIVKACSSWVPTAASTTNAGNLILAARVENTHIGKGHELKFSVALRNKCSLNVESIQATIVERIDWEITDHAGPRRDSSSLASIDCGQILSLHYKKSATDVDKSPPKVDDVLSSEMHGEMTSPRSILELKVPLSARDTYKGKLIQVSHHLVITAMAEGSHNPSHIEIPIEVFDPPVESLSHSLTPSDSKQVADLATTVWPDETFVPLSPHHVKSESRNSCLSINEDEPVAEDTNEGMKE